MAARRKKKRKKGKKRKVGWFTVGTPWGAVRGRGKRRVRRGGRIPLPVLEKRLKRLSKIVTSRR